jgi:hypothetical protein
VNPSLPQDHARLKLVNVSRDMFEPVICTSTLLFVDLTTLPPYVPDVVCPAVARPTPDRQSHLPLVSVLVSFARVRQYCLRCCLQCHPGRYRTSSIRHNRIGPVSTTHV